MKTTQVMEREFYDGTVRQNHKTGWLCATDLLKIGNRYRNSINLSPVMVSKYFSQKSTIEFAKQIMKEEQISSIKTIKRGKNGGTWCHPLIFIDIAMWVNPSFKYVAMSWLKDNLLKNRDLSGDSYREMASSLDRNYNLGARIGVIIPKVAREIKAACKVDDWNTANEDQLKMRDEIHRGIRVLSAAKVKIEDVAKIAITEATNGGIKE